MNPPGYEEFEFDLPDALLTKLVEKFEVVGPAQLTAENVNKIPEEQGVYQLFLEDAQGVHLVYVGKTDAESGLRDRLGVHALKIQQRVGLDPLKIWFKAIRVYVFTILDLETQLVKHYKRTNTHFENHTWNNSGFGSNDPGRERDTTKYDDDHFYTRFPVDVARTLDFTITQTGKAGDILQALKTGLPYLVRFETKGKSRKPHDDLADTDITLDPSAPMTPESVIAQVMAQLPAGWQATMLPSHVIIYKNDRKANDYYSGARVLGLSPGTAPPTP